MRQHRYQINWNRKHFSLLLVFFFLLVISMYSARSVSASEGLSEDSILPTSYRDEGDTDQWPLDLRFATNTAHRTIYRDGKIYLQLYSCSWAKSSYSGNYMLRYFIQKGDGTVIWFPDQDRGAFLSDWSNVRNVYGIDLHKSFWMEPMEIPGAKPKKPSISFSDRENYQVHADFTGAADKASGTYHYDYFAYHKSSGKQSFAADGGTAADVTDYLTGFYFKIDETNGDVPLRDFSWVTSDDSSGRKKSIGLDIPASYVNTERQYYLHLCSRSYTGQISDMETLAIPRKGLHTLHYDLKGGSGNFPDQLVIYGRKTCVHGDKPFLEGSVFTGWSGPEGILQPGDDYRHSQDGGQVTLTANWEENRYRIIYHGNGREGINGQVSGDVTAEDKVWSSIGIAENAFINESKQEDGRPQYQFRGWGFRSDQTEPDLIADPKDPEWASKIRIRDLAKTLGIDRESGKEIHLYAVWDQAPHFEGKREVYFNHKPDLTELLSLVKAYDREDGREAPETPMKTDQRIGSFRDGWKTDAAGQVRLLDYRPEEIDGFGDCGSMTLTYRASDQGGNISNYSIKVWILTDTALKESGSNHRKQTYIRYIDKENYGRDYAHGGLRENSIWRQDPSYKAVLDGLFA